VQITIGSARAIVGNIRFNAHAEKDIDSIQNQYKIGKGVKKVVKYFMNAKTGRIREVQEGKAIPTGDNWSEITEEQARNTRKAYKNEIERLKAAGIQVDPMSSPAQLSKIADAAAKAAAGAQTDSKTTVPHTAVKRERKERSE
jgi:hypothetical protein